MDKNGNNPWSVVAWIIVGLLAYIAMVMTLAWVYAPTKGIPGL